MADKKQIFRSVSLERLASPEQLDQLMQVISPKGWVALLALLGLVVAAIAWGIFGSLPSTVSGTCILVKPGGVAEVLAPGAGRIADISVDVGDTVRAGQLIARIERQDGLAQIRAGEARLHELQAQEDRLKALTALSTEQMAAYFADAERNLGNRIATAEQRIGALEAKIRNQSRLLEQGLITAQTLAATRLEHAGVQQDIDNFRNEIRQLAVRRIDTHKQVQNELSAIRLQINEARRNLDNLLRSTDAASLAYSPYHGRVLEIRLAEGALVNPGTPILAIEHLGGGANDLEARIFITPLDGKKIKPNMDVQISPSTVRREEFGVMLGKVRTVADFPSTTQGMMRLLNNEELVRQLAAGAPPIAVQADLTPSTATLSGYKWSSPNGPEVHVESGTLCTASITVRKQRPITLAIPALRNWLGL